MNGKHFPYRLVALLLALAASALWCGGEGEPRAVRPVVAVSVLPQAFLVERLAGEAVEVVVMIPPGASPATHEPTMDQLTAVSRAALYVKVGHPHFPFEETWLSRLLGRGEGRLRVFDCAAGTELDHEDPHLWTSPRQVRALLPRLAEELQQLLPSSAGAIAASRDRLAADLDALDKELGELFTGLERREFFVFHPAWGYLARDHGLEQVAIERGHAEPSPEELSRTIDRARAAGARAVFVQPQSSHRAAEVVAREIGAEIRALDPLSRDYLVNLRQVGRALADELGR
ncbi:MAG: zinc ABC transporter substrate-binding protein [Deltaproteobacteria bacterium]|nr:zinc ABC transporter substrate-binding protein [Deltaproteobacteria bacterium]